MRTFILITFLSVSLSSCQTYQYLTVASDNATHNEKNEFVAESDTLRITYNFNGKNGPVKIHIYNKSATALEVDWKRSSLVIGDTPVPFYVPALQIDGSIIRSASSRNTSAISGTIQGREGVEFLPPHSEIERSGLYIKRRLFDTKAVTTTTETFKAETGGKIKIAKASFSKNNSPMLFRCYLTFVVPGTTDAVFATEQSFYLSELKQSITQPQYIMPEKEKAGDKFYIAGMPAYR